MLDIFLYYGIIIVAGDKKCNPNTNSKLVKTLKRYIHNPETYKLLNLIKFIETIRMQKTHHSLSGFFFEKIFEFLNKNNNAVY